MPDNHQSSSTNSISWSKGGKVVRMSDKSLVISDVRTRSVTNSFISFGHGFNSNSLMLVKSSKSRAWCIDRSSVLYVVDLAGSLVLQREKLPFKISSHDVSERSSLIYLKNIKMGEINEIMIKKGPKKIDSEVIKRETFDLTYYEGAYNSAQYPSEPCLSDKTLPLKSISYETPSSASYTSSTPSSNSSFDHYSNSSSTPTSLNDLSCEKLPPIASSVHNILNSLFFPALDSLSRIDVQSFPPVDSFRSAEHFVLNAIFSLPSNLSPFDSIRDVIKYYTTEEPSLKNFLLQILIDDVSFEKINDYYAASGCAFNGISAPDRLVMTFLLMSKFSKPQCNSSDLHDLLFEKIDGESLVIENIHFICSFLVSMGSHQQAKELYLRQNYFIEALVVSLLGGVEWIDVLHGWISFISQYCKVSKGQLGYFSIMMKTINHWIPGSDSQVTTATMTSRIKTTLINYSARLQTQIDPDIAIYSPDCSMIPSASVTPTRKSSVPNYSRRFNSPVNNQQ